MSELPKSWVQIPLGDDTISKKGKKPKTLVAVSSSGLVPYLDIKAFEKGIFEKYATLECGVESTINDSLMVWDGARSGLVGNGVAGVIGSTLMRIRPKASNNRYLHYFLRSKFSEINSKTKGTGIPHVDPAILWNFEFPIAPLNEQIRIADKLDSMLAKVDAAQARLDKIPNILKRFRQSVLAAATSGELTKEWREAHNILIAHWESTVFYDLSREITVGFVGKMSDKYKESGIPFLRSQNVRAFRFDSKNLLYIDDEFHNKIYKSRLEKGDLAVVRSGAPGTTCVIPESLGVANCSDLVIVRPNERLLSEYGCIYMNSSIAQKNVSDNKVGVAQQHFNVGSMKIMPINLPSIVEQKEIVRRVESLFTMADTVEKQYKDAKARTNRLTQSTLAKAFRGELIPQDPTDEPAEKLLEKIKLEHLKENPITGKKKAPAKPKKAVNLTKTVSNKAPDKDQLTTAVEVDLLDENRKLEHVKEEPLSAKKKAPAKPKEAVNLTMADGKKAPVNDEPSTAIAVDLTDEKITLKNWLGTDAKYAESAIKNLKGATFTTEQFQSVTGFKKTYEELKTLILSLVKGGPGISEPLIEITNWEEKTGEYSFKLKDVK